MSQPGLELRNPTPSTSWVLESSVFEPHCAVFIYEKVAFQLDFYGSNTTHLVSAERILHDFLHVVEVSCSSCVVGPVFLLLVLFLIYFCPLIISSCTWAVEHQLKTPEEFSSDLQSILDSPFLFTLSSQLGPGHIHSMFLSLRITLLYACLHAFPSVLHTLGQAC